MVFAVIVNPALATPSRKPSGDLCGRWSAACISPSRTPQPRWLKSSAAWMAAQRRSNSNGCAPCWATNILTAEVRRNGLGGIDAARFERSIDQLAEGFKFQKRPVAADIFDDQFLPPINGRLIN